VRSSVGVQLQHGELPEKLRVGEALRLFASFYPEPADPTELTEVLGLQQAVNRPWGVLSGGQKQRLSIALALIGGPRIAILDELTTGLDPAARRETWDLIEAVRDRGTTVLLVTHFMQEAERLCDRIAVIDDGRVTALDTPAGIVAGIDSGQRMRFRLAEPVNDRLFTDLPEVTDLVRSGDQLQLTGTADLVIAVTSVLARNGLVAGQLRIEQPSLDDAFIAMTSRPAKGHQE
jgi:ABC-2 type transport system ATP-binding protein